MNGMTQSEKSGLLGKVLLNALVLDVVWAISVATFGFSLLSAVGQVAGSAPAATVTTGVAAWIVTFFVAMFQGAIFMVVGSVFGFIGLLAYTKMPAGAQKVVRFALYADVLWAVVMATLNAGLLSMLDSAAVPSVGSAPIGAFATALLWGISFVAAYIQGLIFIFVIGGFCCILAFVAAVLLKGSK